jgi:hypothetical protein
MEGPNELALIKIGGVCAFEISKSFPVNCASPKLLNMITATTTVAYTANRRHTL